MNSMILYIANNMNQTKEQSDQGSYCFDSTERRAAFGLCILVARRYSVYLFSTDYGNLGPSTVYRLKLFINTRMLTFSPRGTVPDKIKQFSLSCLPTWLVTTEHNRCNTLLTFLLG